MNGLVDLEMRLKLFSVSALNRPTKWGLRIGPEKAAQLTLSPTIETRTQTRHP